jgi:hypothetical protein
MPPHHFQGGIDMNRTSPRTIHLDEKEQATGHYFLLPRLNYASLAALDAYIVTHTQNVPLRQVLQAELWQRQEGK